MKVLWTCPSPQHAAGYSTGILIFDKSVKIVQTSNLRGNSHVSLFAHKACYIHANTSFLPVFFIVLLTGKGSY